MINLIKLTVNFNFFSMANLLSNFHDWKMGIDFPGVATMEGKLSKVQATMEGDFYK